MSNVIIEEVSDDIVVRKEEQQKRKNNFEDTMKAMKKRYTHIDEERVKRDFMYMMISGKDPKEKRHFIETLVSMIEKTFVTTKDDLGLDASEIYTLKRILATNDQECQDMLWFLSLHLLENLSYWILHGSTGADGRKIHPPPINDRDMFNRFLRGNVYSSLCKSFLNKELDLKGFTIAMRTEYAMNVGFVDVRETHHDSASNNAHGDKGSV